MKCEKCGSNEAMFHYQSIINGEKTEYHLCTDCAKEEGFADTLAHAFRPAMAMNSLWGNPYGLMNSFFGSPFGSLMGHAPSQAMAMPPWYGVFVGEGEPSTNAGEKSADNVPEDAGAEIRSKRELCQLKSQLKQAVKAEEFEKAAEIRDKIREMEK